jgi:hypothetical protein
LARHRIIVAIVRIIAVGALPLTMAGASGMLERGESQDSLGAPGPPTRVKLPDESTMHPGPGDGEGSVTVSPETVTAATTTTMTFEFTVGPTGIAPGGGIACLVSAFWGWSPPQSDAPTLPGYCTVACDNPDVALNIIVDIGSQAIYAQPQERSLAPGDVVRFVYGDTDSGRNPSAAGRVDTYSEREERFFFRVDGDGDGFYVALPRQPVFRVLPGLPSQLVALAPSRATIDSPYEISVAVVDPVNNLVEDFAGAVRLKSEGVDASYAQEVEFTPADRGAKRVQVIASAPGPVVIQVAAIDANLRPGATNPTLAAEPADERLHLFWGDLHGHSNVSDGTGTPEDYYRYARDVARLDVVALTDHDYWGYAPLAKEQAAWRRNLDVTRAFNRPGQFVTLPGYEWTNWTWGHMHVLFADELDATIIAWNQPAGESSASLWAALAGKDCVTIPHHVGGSTMPFDWTALDARYAPVVEIASVHGVSEALGHPRGVSRPVESGMVQAALARGYRLGILGSGDTHDGHPGVVPAGGGLTGLAGIYARELTRPAILEAIRARRVYATTGCRAILRFHAGGTPMGGVVSDGRTERRFTVAVFGTAPIDHIAIVRDNETVAVRKGDGLLTSWNWTDHSERRSESYYYARIRQTDGHWIYSSPIWFESAAPVTSTQPAASRPATQP